MYKLRRLSSSEPCSGGDYALPVQLSDYGNSLLQLCANKRSFLLRKYFRQGPHRTTTWRSNSTESDRRYCSKQLSVRFCRKLQILLVHVRKIGAWISFSLIFTGAQWPLTQTGNPACILHFLTDHRKKTQEKKNLCRIYYISLRLFFTPPTGRCHTC